MTGARGRQGGQGGRGGSQREAHKEGFDLKPRQTLACVTPSVACVLTSLESTGLRTVIV